MSERIAIPKEGWRLELLYLPPGAPPAPVGEFSPLRYQDCIVITPPPEDPPGSGTCERFAPVEVALVDHGGGDYIEGQRYSVPCAWLSLSPHWKEESEQVPEDRQ